MPQDQERRKADRVEFIKGVKVDEVFKCIRQLEVPATPKELEAKDLQ